MIFVLRLVVGGMLSSFGSDIYEWTKDKTQRTATYHKVMANIDLKLKATGVLLRHLFSIKTIKKF